MDVASAYLQLSAAYDDAVLWTVASKAQAATDWLAAHSTTPPDLAAA